MTVTFFSNFLLLHQTPFCEAMVSHLGDRFKFVATEKIPADRLAMGYEDLSHAVDYAVNSYESDEAYAEAMKLGRESDVVIIGSAPDVFINERLKHNKLTFRYSERFFKEGKWRLFDPRVLKSYYSLHFRYRKKPLYMLCASAYTAPDCRFLLSYPGKTFKWGYFPEVKEYNESNLMTAKRQAKPSILWVGRLIKYKRPEHAINLANNLVKRGFDFNLTIIGEGPMRTMLEKAVNIRGLKQYVKFKNYMPQSDVRRHMEQANIFIFTSNQQEGWGAVLNEAMNSGCAVVANDQIGSVPFLIEEGKNGLTYHKTAKSLLNQVEKLINDSALSERIGLCAYRTIKSVWNADNASKRLLCLINSINSGSKFDIENGPISKA